MERLTGGGLAVEDETITELSGVGWREEWKGWKRGEVEGG